MRRYTPVRKISSTQRKRLKRLAEIRKRWWTEKERDGVDLICGICHTAIHYFEDLDSDHIEPGHGKSDNESNLQPAHKRCNILKGSRRNFKIAREDGQTKGL